VKRSETHEIYLSRSSCQLDITLPIRYTGPVRMTTVERALECQRLKGLVRKVLAKIQGRTLYPTSGSNQINVHLKKGIA
jgi:hypothetical protein